jgi:uncharacterized protein HemX
MNEDNHDRPGLARLERADRDAAKAGDEAAATEPRRRGNAAAGWALLLSLLTLAAVAAGGWFGYQQWLQIDRSLARVIQSADRSESARSDLAQQMAALQRAFTAEKTLLEQQRQELLQGREELDAERKRLSGEYAGVQTVLARIDQRIGSSDTRWMAAEAAYLVALANERLQLGRDVSTAVLALQAADRRLHESGDAAWAGVRQALGKEIARLQALKMPDRERVSGRLAQLERQVGSLPLALTGSEEEAAPAPKMATDGSWQALLDDLKRGLRSVLVIRRHPQPVRVALPPAQRDSLYLDLRLRLADARLALLRGDRVLYQAGLETADDLLGMFFALDDPAVRGMREELAALRKIQVAPDLPDISATLTLLRQQLALAGDRGGAQ